MDKRVKENKFLNNVIMLGTWIYQLFLLQILWFFYALKGLILGGIFPATAGAVKVFYRWFSEKSADFSIQDQLNETFRSEFKKANAVGYSSLAIILILYIDLRVSNVFIQSIFLHTMLLLFSGLILSVGLYLFTVLTRYDFTLLNIFKQSFFIALSVPIYTVAAAVSLILSVALLSNYAFLLIFFGIPIILAPIVWFTYSGMLVAETKRAEDV